MAGRPKTGKPRRVRLVTTVSQETMLAISSAAESKKESRGQAIDRAFSKATRKQ